MKSYITRSHNNRVSKHAGAHFFSIVMTILLLVPSTSLAFEPGLPPLPVRNVLRGIQLTAGLAVQALIYRHIFHKIEDFAKKCAYDKAMEKATTEQEKKAIQKEMYPYKVPWQVNGKLSAEEAFDFFSAIAGIHPTLLYINLATILTVGSNSCITSGIQGLRQGSTDSHPVIKTLASAAFANQMAQGTLMCGLAAKILLSILYNKIKTSPNKISSIIDCCKILYRASSYFVLPIGLSALSADSGYTKLRNEWNPTT